MHLRRESSPPAATACTRGAGSSGLEAIPNIEFWRVFFGYVSHGASVVYYGVQCQSAPSQDDMLYHGVADDDDDIVIKMPAKRLG